MLQSDVELADAQQLLSKAKNEFQTQKVMLNILLGFSPEKPVDYIGTLSSGIYDFNMDLSACMACSHENRPEMEISDISLEMGEKDLAIQSGQFSPKITANADYYIRNNWYDNQGTDSLGQAYDLDQENTYWTVMIQLQWDFNLGGKQFYQRGRAVHEIDRLKQHRKSTWDTITAQVQMSYTTLLEARGRIDFSQTALQSARESYERTQKRYEVQVGTIYELLDIQASLTRAEANCNQAETDYRLSLANLYYAMGQQNFALTENQPPEDPATNARDRNGDQLNDHEIN
ncbi:MAG: TolC family protein [Desulfobacteraceae bacterium]|nr:TolC family protein [Desulfobacteraceae bacterium]